MQGARLISRNLIVNFGAHDYSHALSARELPYSLTVQCCDHRGSTDACVSYSFRARVSCACIMSEQMFRLKFEPR